MIVLYCSQELPQPFRTMLEVIAKYMKEQGGQINLGSSRSSRVAENQDRLSSSGSTTSTAKVKSSFKQDTKRTSQTHSDHAQSKEDQNKLNSSEKNDYEDLLRRLDDNTVSKRQLDRPTRERKDRERQESVLQKQQQFKTESTSSQNILGSMTRSDDDRTTGNKSQRNRTRNLGGPIMSSELASLRNGRTGRQSGSMRVGHSLNLGKNSFFVDEDPTEDVDAPGFHESLDFEHKTVAVSDIGPALDKAVISKSTL